MARRHGDASTPSPSYVVKQLQNLGFIDYAPHATAQYEMTRPFAELMANLLREYRMTSVEVIRSYFTAMDKLADEIRQALDDDHGDLLVSTLRDTAEHVERMRHDSRLNREKIVATAMRLKSNKGRIPARRRFEIINRLWKRYLVPLRDMIDTEKHMEESLDRMEGVLEEAAQAFEADAAVEPVVRMGRARVRRLRRDVVEDFRESIREITPLYEELRRENALARGASHALERIANDGLSSLGIPETLCVCNWQQRGLFSDDALEAYLHTVKGYTPSRPDPLRKPEARTGPKHIRLDRFDAEVAESLPILDALEWLAESYPEAPKGTRWQSQACGLAEAAFFRCGWSGDPATTR
jgi:hypothetical protein